MELTSFVCYQISFENQVWKTEAEARKWNEKLFIKLVVRRGSRVFVAREESRGWGRVAESDALVGAEELTRAE